MCITIFAYQLFLVVVNQIKELNYRLLQMEENLVDYALTFGWKPDVKKLWEKWLNIVGADEDISVSLLLIDLLEEKCSSDELKLEWLIERGFISTEAESYMDGVNLIKTE